ncbi:hypothetical protein [Sphingobium subterraneum]|uniref:Zinc-ribbon domain-containing protein n=1 Tax=Sphingobium subterraneum TaxID=627688 RepID=A0A841J100_9SPHN|nr:hypothetical protein [Sphingobium subterraneum]MBB6124384.1 hypothetical protein [Sphingobium subterraneum]
MSSTCRSCNGAIADGSRFCPHCGAAVAATPSGQNAFSSAASDLMDVGRTLSKNPFAKKVAAGAAIGAAVAIPVPIIGWATGAVIGGGIVAYKHWTRR